MTEKERRRLFKGYEDRMFDLRVTIKEACVRAGITQAAYSYAKSGVTARPIRVLRSIETALDEMEAEKAS